MIFREKIAEYLEEYKVPHLGTKRLKMEVILYPRDKRVQDIDNRIKALWDALEGWVYEDDSQIDVLVVQRGEIRKGGGCFVLIQELENESNET